MFYTVLLWTAESGISVIIERVLWANRCLLTAKICRDSGQELPHFSILLRALWHSAGAWTQSSTGQLLLLPLHERRGGDTSASPSIRTLCVCSATDQPSRLKGQSWCSGDCRTLTKSPDYGRGFQDNLPLKTELWCNLKHKKCEVKGEKWIHWL